MDWKLTPGFFPQIWWENLNLSRMHYCFGQPFILFILPQIAEYMEWYKLPL